VRQIARVCEILGLSGLAETLAHAQQNHLATQSALMTNARGSYRIAWVQQNLLPMHRPDHVAALQAGGEASSAERSQLPRPAAAS
jgi:hypothetical protein